MKIRILGFELNTSEGLPLSEFYNVLVGVSAEQQATLARILTDGVDAVPVGSRPDRIICIDRSGPLWRGMFVKLRSARSFMTIVRENTILRLTAEQLQHNKAMAEVNFFVLNEVTGRGLYQYYHQSTHLDGFCAFCRTIYDQAVVSLRNALQQKLSEGHLTRDAVRQQMELLRETLTYAIMVRKENLPALVSEFEQISSVEIVLSSKNVVKAEYRPLTECAMRQTERFVFGRQSSRRKDHVKAAVMEAVGALSRERKARIVGMLPGRLMRVYDLEQNYDVLGELDYDQTAKDLKVDFSDLRSSLAQSAFIGRLTEIANRPDVKARLEAPRQ